MTCAPAPMANRSSVALADSETIRCGRFGSVTEPLAAATVIGNSGAPAAEAYGQAAVSATATAAAISLRRDIKNLREMRRRDVPSGLSTCHASYPFLRGLASRRKERSWLVPRRGLTVAATAPD